MNICPKLLISMPILAIIIVASLLVVVALIILLLRKKPSKINYDEFVEALGNFENIEDATCINSRLNVVVKDKSLLNKEKLQSLGASAIVVTSKKVTLVMGRQSQEIAMYIKKHN